ncbi:NYN domain-containing protein [Mechercharimyces sp. CAU 1602]|uniref:NYN domain-containing protein n=1 Tax=Mechercharimyces sp. CAU 1602 TaxID=2973933 RepID=UPI0021619000|nr:NYN domain-containing protein [Mechercharimyces sp. CAU 1602]MCS1352516.1 NYN domain-containing protein [Mechercharimyces sp. CAU 1602]
MEEWLIVDGYNVIGAGRPGFSHLAMDEARQRLIEDLSEYQAVSGRRVIVVFDAHQVEGAENKSYEHQVTIYYTKQHETADEWIERWVRKQRGQEKEIYVATSDYLEQRMILGHGAYRISARELMGILADSRKRISERIVKKKERTNKRALSDHLNEDILRTFENWRRKK